MQEIDAVEELPVQLVSATPTATERKEGEEREEKAGEARAERWRRLLRRIPCAPFRVRVYGLMTMFWATGASAISAMVLAVLCLANEESVDLLTQSVEVRYWPYFAVSVVVHTGQIAAGGFLFIAAIKRSAPLILPWILFALLTAALYLTGLLILGTRKHMVLCMAVFVAYVVLGLPSFADVTYFFFALRQASRRWSDGEERERAYATVDCGDCPGDDDARFSDLEDDAEAPTPPSVRASRVKEITARPSPPSYEAGKAQNHLVMLHSPQSPISPTHHRSLPNGLVQGPMLQSSPLVNGLSLGAARDQPTQGQSSQNQPVQNHTSQNQLSSDERLKNQLTATTDPAAREALKSAAKINFAETQKLLEESRSEYIPQSPLETPTQPLLSPALEDRARSSPPALLLRNIEEETEEQKQKAQAGKKPSK